MGGERGGEGELAGEKEEERRKKKKKKKKPSNPWAAPGAGGLRACAAVPRGRCGLPSAGLSGAGRWAPPLSCAASRCPSSPGSGGETHFKSS